MKSKGPSEPQHGLHSSNIISISAISMHLMNCNDSILVVPPPPPAGQAAFHARLFFPHAMTIGCDVNDDSDDDASQTDAPPLPPSSQAASQQSCFAIVSNRFGSSSNRHCISHWIWTSFFNRITSRNCLKSTKNI